MINILNWDSFNEAYNKPRAGGKKRWSVKYKKSINCSNPKGFSQKQYCKRKRKGGGYKNESVEPNYFLQSSNNHHPTDFDTYHLDEVKDIFNEFAEENNFYQFEWSIDSSPQEVGINYTYFTWVELESQPNEDKDKLARKLMNDMLTEKYFNIQVDINEEMEYKKQYGGTKCTSQYDEIIQKINDNFIKRIETLGYKVKVSNGSMGSHDIWTDQILLKINYSEA